MNDLRLAAEADASHVMKVKHGPVVAAFHHFPPYPGAGSIRAVHFARALASSLGSSAGVVVMTTVTDQAVASLETGYQVVALSDDPIDNRRSLVSRALGEISLGLKAVRLAFRLRPGLLVISSPGFIFAMAVVIGARLLRIPYILDVRDIYPEVYVSAGVLRSGSTPVRLLSWLSTWAYRNAAHIVAATAGLARHIRERAGDVAVDIVYNGYPTSLRALQTEKRDRFTCVFHGILGFYQDAASILELARALEPHDIDVVVIGYGRGEEVFGRPAPRNLKFLGRRPFDETIALVSRSHVGLCLRTDDPISRDAFPVKVFEYVGMGLPCLVTPPCEAGDFVEQHGCGRVFQAGEIDGMTQEILQLRDDADHYQARVDACATSGLHFTREIQAAKFADIVTGVVSSCAKPA